MSIPKSIEKFLIDFGLNEKEISIYLALLRSGPSTVMDISRDTAIKRSTTHNTVEELIKKGLVTQTNYGERRMVVAEDPEKLNFLLDQKKWQLKQISDALPQAISQIYNIVPDIKSTTDVEVKYYEGSSAIRSIYREVLKTNELRSYVNINKIFEVFPENPQLFPAEVDKGHLKMWEIIEDSPTSREYIKTVDKKNYKYKTFSDKWNSKMFFDYMIFKGHIVIISAEGQPATVKAVMIINDSIYENAKLLFDMMWDLLPEPSF